ncbi:restriction endonuclease subunit S [Microcystis aeruginosa]|uniref:restriction endonuclease subunit S n=1 Tax=Microcystis aeruginosa TaxID=1126 RepID=UPI00232A93E5|nr:restriction endonuclease subunit S [Microcystis aeruginosa]MDB9414373.1 restriction endonuclease subunit S [Microcystis aeruginosa CS-567/02]
MKWAIATLGEVAKIERKGIDASDIVPGTEFLGLEHIQIGGEIIGSQRLEYGDISSTKFRFTQAHVLYGKLRPYLAKIALPDFEGICSTDILPIAPGPNLDRKYLAYYLRQPSMVDLANSRSTGANLPRLSPKVLETFKIPLPPLEEQRRIAAILDKADGVRRKRKEAIRLTEELLKSTFLEMFGDPVTNPKGWEIVSLGSLLKFLTSGSRGWAKYYAESGSLFLRIQNVKAGRLLLDDIAYVDAPDSTEARRTFVQEGDVLVSMTADLGRTAVIPKGLGKAHINQHLALLRLDREYILPTYAAAFLTSVGGQIQFDRLNRESVKAGLNFDDLRGLKILLPPIEKQIMYSDFLESQTNSLNRQKAADCESENLFNSLLQKAFRGEL